MSKFCTSCGTQLNDNATFCTSCGAPQKPQANINANANVNPNVNNVQPQGVVNNGMPNMNGGAAAGATPAENVKNAFNNAATKFSNFKYKNLVIVGAVLVVAIIALIIVLCLIFGGGNYKTPVENLVKVYEDGDGKAYREMICLTDDMEDAMNSLLKLADGKDIDDLCEEKAEKLHENLVNTYGDDLEVSYEIVEKEEIDKDEFNNISLSSLASLGSLGKSDEEEEITEAYKLKIELSFEGDKKDGTRTKTLRVVKCDGKWSFASGEFSIY